MFEEYGWFSVYPKWRGAPLIPSDSALREIKFFGMDLHDIKNVLEEGVETEKRRKKGVVEKVLVTGGRSVKVVAAESFNAALKTECWVIVHVGSVKL